MKIWKMILGLGTTLGLGAVLWSSRKSLESSNRLKSRYREYYDITNQWLQNKNEQKDVTQYFNENGIENIAIYGMGELGNRLYEELKDSSITIRYFIDKDANETYYGDDNIPVIAVGEIVEQEDVDAIIITPIYDFEVIEEQLLDKNVEVNIISLEDVIYGI